MREASTALALWFNHNKGASLAENPVIIWFRNDLRLSDNPALHAGIKSGKPLILLYIHDEKSKGLRAFGAAFKWWRHNSLRALEADIASRGGRLIFRSGAAMDVLKALVKETSASAIYWNRRYTEAEQAVDSEVKKHFKDQGLEVESYNGSLLIEPWQVKKDDGGWYQVFTPFWRRAQELTFIEKPLPSPSKISSFSDKIASDNLDDWGFIPTKPDWAGGMRAFWQPGEKGAHERLKTFLDEGLEGYGANRDRPDLAEGTSRLSPYLAHGEISPAQIWRAVDALKGQDHPSSEKDRQKFISEVGWREFSYNLLYHFPAFATRNFRKDFDNFPWEKNEKALLKWQKGQTGYPIVDAGMRQLWQTGWMHNRVRMIVASFLIKDLMVHWRVGEEWFWDTLVDADPANNAASWQWVAGSGADAAPYFRIFNPVTQGQKHDPKGDYIRNYVKELENLDEKAIHEPEKADDKALLKARVKLGESYPRPIVDHSKARNHALEAYQSLKG